ncbi:HIT domain-containing protein [Estrella lausannensis]|uniref:Histidine triad (HIT) protein n=1 Tax=Estrella lausannensis TaxID=483423 RepID=A0A0H5E7P6_9BACT|nr:HIT family protein [Estrella lausannensis]CRX39355.1 Histidine triad (HIT) protein [Estrella lausannensis]
MSFTLHPNFASKERLLELPLSVVLLETEKPYPWLILVPKREGARRLLDLSFEDRVQLMKEIELAERTLFNEFTPDQMNVCQIGIKTPQLHIHVIARFKEDPSWPDTVFENSSTEWFLPFDRQTMRERILQRIQPPL